MKDWLIDHAKLFFTGIALTAALLCLWLFLAGVVTVGTALALYLLLCCVGFFVVNGYAFRELRPAGRALDEYCDPEPLLALSQRILAQNPKSSTFAVNGALALILLDRREEALALLEPLEGERRIWKTEALTRTYCICRADLAPDGEAEYWLDRLEEAVGKTPGIARVLEEQRATLALRRGETEGLEPIFLDRLSRAPKPRITLAWHYELGKLYLAQGRKAEAAEHLRFVVERGNKLYVRVRAEELLREL